MSDDPLVPAHLPRDHPVVVKRYSLFTNAIAEMVEKLEQWIDVRCDGGTIYGPSRTGKSNAVNFWLAQLLAERYGGHVPLVIWSHNELASTASPASLHTALLRAVDAVHVNRRRGAEVRLIQLVERLVELASTGWGNYLVLVIDEAQDMSQREWLWMVQLHAILERESVQLCVVSIASFQFNDAPRHLALTGSAHAAARFMLHAAPFRGLRNLQEVRYVLAAYDKTTWPAQDGQTFTEAVAPAAWREGSRLADCAHHLWNALHSTLPDGYAGPIEFPMQSIALSARQILLRAGGSQPWDEMTGGPAWHAAVASTGHARLMALISANAVRRRTAS